MRLRQEFEKLEESLLSPFAALSGKSRGRERFEEPCDVRTAFQRDRDRIIHSKAFRRLKYKTQVFIAPEGDHYRTRLMHTLEVQFPARQQELWLKRRSYQAIAGVRLGHTPFGHAGGKLRAFPPGLHNEQSLRVVDFLEGEKGLNLTWEVRDGILKHTGESEPLTLEGQLVRICDRIAYINHDIDDALRGGILKYEQLPAEEMKILGKGGSQRLNTMIRDLIQNSRGRPRISMSREISEVMESLRRFLYKFVYVGSPEPGENAKFIIVFFIILDKRPRTQIRT